MNLSEVQLQAIAAVPEKRRTMVRRAVTGEASPRMAIKAQCFICSGYDLLEAENCNVTTCCLYAYNSYRKESRGTEE